MQFKIQFYACLFMPYNKRFVVCVYATFYVRINVLLLLLPVLIIATCIVQLHIFISMCRCASSIHKVDVHGSSRKSCFLCIGHD